MAIWKILSGKYYDKQGNVHTPKPGENTFEASNKEVAGFLDLLECIKPDEDPEGAESYLVHNLKVVMRPGRKGKGGPRYNVVNERTGNAINEIPLTLDEAKALVNGDDIPLTADDLVATMTTPTEPEPRIDIEDDQAPERESSEDLEG